MTARPQHLSPTSPLSVTCVAGCETAFISRHPTYSRPLLPSWGHHVRVTESRCARVDDCQPRPLEVSRVPRLLRRPVQPSASPLRHAADQPVRQSPLRLGCQSASARWKTARRVLLLFFFFSFLFFGRSTPCSLVWWLLCLQFFYLYLSTTSRFAAMIPLLDS